MGRYKLGAMRRIKMSKISPAVYDLARQIASFEAASTKTSNGYVNVTVLVCDKLRVHLTKLAGYDGFNSLLSRALTLAKHQAPELKDVEVQADGSLRGLDKMGECGKETGTILVAQLLSLLITFIGAPLTMALLHDIWPEAPIDTTDRSEDKA
jgi:hypothetical protein